MLIDFRMGKGEKYHRGAVIVVFFQGSRYYNAEIKIASCNSPQKKPASQPALFFKIKSIN